MTAFRFYHIFILLAGSLDLQQQERIALQARDIDSRYSILLLPRSFIYE